MKNRIIKKNPVVGKAKKIKTKNINNLASEEENEVKTFIIIIVVIVLIAGVIYFVTEIFTRSNEVNPELVTSGNINYNKITVGMLMNRPYDNYYVLVYDADSSEAIKYSTLMDIYMQKDKKDVKKIYHCDLSNSFNSKYYNVNDDNVSNPKAKSVKDLDFGNLTLLEIKEGKIVNYLEDYTIIQEKLK